MHPSRKPENIVLWGRLPTPCLKRKSCPTAQTNCRGKVKRSKSSYTQTRKKEIKKSPIFDPMLKKYTTILLMFTAYAILLGHNIVPHHHDSDHDLTEHHQTSPHHHDDDHKDKWQGDFFSHFIHSTDGVTFTGSYNISNTLSKQLFSLIAVLPDNFSLDEFLIPPLLHKPPAEHFIYISPHSLSSGLRAPPAFIG